MECSLQKHKQIQVVHHWAGCPKSANSKWQRFLAVVRRCHQEGWRNILVLSRMPDDAALVEPFTDAGCEIVLQQRSRGNFDPASIRRTYRLLRRLKCDIFHCHNDHTSPLIGAALAHVPVRIWSKLSMSSHYERGEVPSGLQSLCLSNRISSRCSHRVLALTEAVRQEFISQGGSARKTVVVPGPVDVERFATVAGDGVREKLGLTDSDIVLTAVGHAVPVKGWDVLVRVFSQLAVDSSNLHLLLVGSTSSPEEAAFAESLRSMAAETGCLERVHMLGHRCDIAEILKASSVFVFPSRSDGQGLALVEAMAAALPCVAARVGGVPDVATDGENALLFERENVQDLTGRLRKLIEDEPLRRQLAFEASRRAEAFSMKVYTDTLLACYRSLLDRSE